MATTIPHTGVTRAVVRAEAGDDGFEAFFRSCYDRLVRALVALTGDGPAAEDLVQEALARAYGRWDRVAAMESPVGYVYATAVNLHRRRMRRTLLRSSDERAAATVADPAEAIASRDSLLGALGRLPGGQRDALLLVEWLGLDAASAGRTLGIEASSVRARIHRAKAALREELER